MLYSSTNLRISLLLLGPVILQDQLKLLRCCVKAMKTRDTSHRLSIVQEHMTNSLNTLAAKCALKSLNLG